MVAPGVGISQQIVALHFHLGLFSLSHSGLAGAQCSYVILGTGIIHFNNRCVSPCAVRCIIQREHGFELKVLQEVPLPVYVARTAVVLRLCGICLQFNVHHRVIHLRFLEAGEGGIQSIFFVIHLCYRSCPQSSGNTL